MSLLLALALSAAPATLPGGDFTTPLPQALDKKSIKAFEKQGRSRIKVTMPIIGQWSAVQLTVALKGTLSDKTAIIYQRGHGVFIEYTGADGSVLMWYPRNRAVVKGRWGVQTNNGVPQACYHYANSVNPVTGVFEPTECINPGQTLSRNVVLSERTGDVFALRSGTLPYSKGALDIPVWPK